MTRPNCYIVHDNGEIEKLSRKEVIDFAQSFKHAKQNMTYTEALDFIANSSGQLNVDDFCFSYREAKAISNNRK